MSSLVRVMLGIIGALGEVLSSLVRVMQCIIKEKKVINRGNHMVEVSCKEKIKGSMDLLTNSEAKVANFVLRCV